MVRLDQTSAIVPSISVVNHTCWICLAWPDRCELRASSICCLTIVLIQDIYPAYLAALMTLLTIMQRTTDSHALPLLDPGSTRVSTP
ncbi:hypothetical protein K461DRAFT_129511 [Myriangium duriaei CBS 260.36]|uniref:Uncharacterized protein n=1 Tax=Myriangium duriaei CBS 260.36 TaxID=1168546 RepID=A0A9P4J2V2_9PEZI|nr:hypothetical protein K461DRAFT_129511 [Myriangium duriaei CBS 260.36]